MYACVCAEADVRCLPPSLPTFLSKMPSTGTIGKHTVSDLMQVPLALSTASSGIIARNHQSHEGSFYTWLGRLKEEYSGLTHGVTSHASQKSSPVEIAANCKEAQHQSAPGFH